MITQAVTELISITSREQLAEALGITQQSVKNYEAGKRKPTERIMAKMIQVAREQRREDLAGMFASTLLEDLGLSVSDLAPAGMVHPLPVEVPNETVFTEYTPVAGWRRDSIRMDHLERQYQAEPSLRRAWRAACDVLWPRHTTLRDSVDVEIDMEEKDV